MLPQRRMVRTPNNARRERSRTPVVAGYAGQSGFMDGVAIVPGAAHDIGPVWLCRDGTGLGSAVELVDRVRENVRGCGHEGPMNFPRQPGSGSRPRGLYEEAW